MGKAENVLASAGRFEITMAALSALSLLAVVYSQHRQKPPEQREQRQRSRTMIIAAWVLLAVTVACAVWLYKNKDAAMTAGAFSGGVWWGGLLSD